MEMQLAAMEERKLLMVFRSEYLGSIAKQRKEKITQRPASQRLTGPTWRHSMPPETN
jgi:hypothetical protein